MKNIIFIAIGGSLGSVCRYIFSKYANSFTNSSFPLGTLLVNISGAFMLGFFFYLFQNKFINSNYKNFLTIGFLGAYTTFSTYSLESVNLLKGGQIKLGLINILTNNLLGILLVIVGFFCADLLLKLVR